MVDISKHYRMVIYLIFYGNYNDMFDIFIRQFKKNWPDCPYPLLIGNQYYHPDEDENILSFSFSEDKRGIERKNVIMDTVHADYYLGFEVDRVIMNSISNEEIEDILDFMDKNEIKYFRCNASVFKKKRRNKFEGYDHYYHIPAKEPYGVCGSTIIWSKELLDERRGSNIEGGYAWEAFHLKRAATTDDLWVEKYATDDRNVFHILHCIEKQEWIRKAKKQLQKEGYSLNDSRKTQTFLKTIEANLKETSKHIPGHIRYKVKQILTKIGFRFTTEY